MISIQYIGKRDTYTEGTYGSKITFSKGETKLVPEELALKLLRHPDQYVRGKGGEAVIIPDTKQKDDDTQDIRDAIANMDTSSLAEYAQIHYGIKLDKRKSVESLRTELTQWVDQYA